MEGKDRSIWYSISWYIVSIIYPADMTRADIQLLVQLLLPSSKSPS
jgi:hypothetical protein